jgi:hypothetical protein
MLYDWFYTSSQYMTMNLHCWVSLTRPFRYYYFFALRREPCFWCSILYTFSNTQFDSCLGLLDKFFWGSWLAECSWFVLLHGRL